MAQKPDLQHRSFRGGGPPPIPAENLSTLRTIARRSERSRSSGPRTSNYTLSRDYTDDKKVHAQRLSALRDRHYGQRGNLRHQSVVGDGGEVESKLKQASLASGSTDNRAEMDNQVEIETGLRMASIEDPAQFLVDYRRLEILCMIIIIVCIRFLIQIMSGRPD